MLSCLWDDAYKRTLAANLKATAEGFLSGYLRALLSCIECIVKQELSLFISNSWNSDLVCNYFLYLHPLKVLAQCRGHTLQLSELSCLEQ